jgi:DNA-binding NarL/FixJ family response regulator
LLKIGEGLSQVNLPTIVVCEDADKLEQIDALIKSQPELVLLGTIQPAAVQQQAIPVGIKITWIELAPDPPKALALLGELKEKYPGMHFLVSHDTLQADLVKSAMQLGAIEYLDTQSAPTLLPEAIKRITVKEQNLPADRSAGSGGPPPPLPPPSDKAAQIVRQTGKMRSKVSQVDGSSTGLPSWVLPSVFLFLLAVFVTLYFKLSH